MSYEQHFLKLAITECLRSLRQGDPPDLIVSMLLRGDVRCTLPRESFLDRARDYIDEFPRLVEQALKSWHLNPLSRKRLNGDDVELGLIDHLALHARVKREVFMQLLARHWDAVNMKSSQLKSFLVAVHQYFPYTVVQQMQVDSKNLRSELAYSFGNFRSDVISQDIELATTAEEAMNAVAKRIGYASVREMINSFGMYCHSFVEVSACEIDSGTQEYRRLQFGINRKHSKLSLARQVERGHIERGALSAMIRNRGYPPRSTTGTVALP